MNPTPAEILKGIPLNHKLNIPPVADNGMAEKMSKPYLILLNAKYNKTKINNNAIGNAMANRDVAF
jgi:hypothetical protein